ncbi:MAG: hypothetical protein KJ560_06065 [Gammaproteobacteria bacterium]|nr:hypothetical protein [Gammaproteobacteria bacterium]MBU2422128.1 hypothetical protein [Gammaproteobacteria bacterium]
MSSQRKIKVSYDKPIFIFSSIIYALVTRYSVLAAVVLIIVLHIIYGLAISKSGAFLGALGLLLSLKHNVIKVASNQDEAIKKSQGMNLNLYYEGTCETELFKQQAARDTTDELVGILLVIAGGLMSSYGDDLTNWLINFSFDRQSIFEFTGFFSLLISCCLFMFSVPVIKIGTGNLLPYEQKEQERFIHEYVKQQINRLLGKYLFVFGLTILMLSAFI